MSNNIIIELSNKNSYNYTNSDFESRFQPIEINNGDTISLKSGYINTIIQDNTNQIYIDSDINLSFDFCYYENDRYRGDYNGTDCYYKQFINDNPDIDNFSYLPCLMFFYDPLNNNEKRLIVNNLTFTLKSGVYTPDSLAEELNRNFVKTDLVNGSSDTGNKLPWTTNPLVLNLLQSGQTITKVFPRYPTGLPMYNYIFHPLYYSVVDKNENKISYNSGYVYQFLTTPFSSEPQNLLFGATQFEISYNKNNNNIFQIDYSHTPCYDDQGNESIIFSIVNEELKIPLKSLSGVICCGMSDNTKKFMAQLGFNTDDMILKFDDLNSETPQPLNFDPNKQMVENMITLDSMRINIGQIPMTISTYSVDNKFWFKQSNITNPIRASQFYSFNDLSPFILVELICNFESKYYDTENNYKHIQIVGSREYTSNNIISLFSDSMNTYVHSGNSINLSSIRCRFLNPIDKKLLQDLRPNNYILLNIQKQNIT